MEGKSFADFEAENAQLRERVRELEQELQSARSVVTTYAWWHCTLCNRYYIDAAFHDCHKLTDSDLTPDQYRQRFEADLMDLTGLRRDVLNFGTERATFREQIAALEIENAGLKLERENLRPWKHSDCEKRIADVEAQLMEAFTKSDKLALAYVELEQQLAAKDVQIWYIALALGWQHHKSGRWHSPACQRDEEHCGGKFPSTSELTIAIQQSTDQLQRLIAYVKKRAQDTGDVQLFDAMAKFVTL
jgi:regulator of replication initiation timing